MKRTIKKSFWVNAEEDREIKRKAQAACLTEAEFLRQRAKGYVPVTRPDDRFWQAMDIIREFSAKIDALAMKTDNAVDMIAIMNEARKWRIFQNAIEKEFLRPKRSDE
jgi:hypothetical protein